MKTIGLIGGMSWESSQVYYELINKIVKQKLGGHHSAKSLMFSVDFQEIKTLQHEGKWDEATQIILDAARRLERGGADFIVICTNTMHKMAEEVMANTTLPLLHIADATGNEIIKKKIKKVALLATGFTMEQDFYKGRLKEKFDLEVLVPDEAGRNFVHDVIYQELCLGIIKSESKYSFIKIIEDLTKHGAEAVILGCTEITLLLSQDDCNIPIFDTTQIHAQYAVEFALRMDHDHMTLES